MCFCSSLGVGDAIGWSIYWLDSCLGWRRNHCSPTPGLETFNCSTKLCVSSLIGVNVGLLSTLWCCFGICSGAKKGVNDPNNIAVEFTCMYVFQLWFAFMCFFSSVADVALKSGVDRGDKSRSTNRPPGVETFNCDTASSAKLWSALPLMGHLYKAPRFACLL